MSIIGLNNNKKIIDSKFTLNPVEKKNPLSKEVYENAFMHESNIADRWQSYELLSCNWARKYDQGFCKEAELPPTFSYSVEDSEQNNFRGVKYYPSFAIEEVEWCVAYCPGRFARRLSHTKRNLGEVSALNVMVFEEKRSAKRFQAYLTAKKSTWWHKNGLLSSDIGYFYIIPWKMDNNFFLRLGKTATRSFEKEGWENYHTTSALRNWCKENCQGDYVVSTQAIDKKFVWFESDDDAAYFKLSYLLPLEDEQE